MMMMMMTILPTENNTAKEKEKKRLKRSSYFLTNTQAHTHSLSLSLSLFPSENSLPRVRLYYALCLRVCAQLYIISDETQKKRFLERKKDTNAH